MKIENEMTIRTPQKKFLPDDERNLPHENSEIGADGDKKFCGYRDKKTKQHNKSIECCF